MVDLSSPDAITAYEKEVRDAGLSDAEINTLHTADNSPAGGHWSVIPGSAIHFTDVWRYSEFDGKDFVTGVQSLTDVYSDIIAGNAELNGVVVTNVSEPHFLRPIFTIIDALFCSGCRWK